MAHTSDTRVVIITFYRFVHLPDYQTLRADLRTLCQQHDIYGTILLASEGINGTIAGSQASIDAIIAAFRTDERLRDMRYKTSYADFIPFKKMKVRLKREIVTIKTDSANPLAQVGTYVDPQDWNDVISDPEVLVIDTRNHFETTIGTFQGAISPQIASFSDFPDFVQTALDPHKHKKVAMFCTGGIRCEKATSYMLAQGFAEVYHLNGGILRYLEEMPAQESLWQGECFVFDERVSVDHQLQPGQATFCMTCKSLLADADTPCPHCTDA
jgi:UPF0176 protein